MSMEAKESSGCDKATEAVLVKSEDMPEGTPECKGFDFNKGLDYDALFKSFIHHGFQATHFGLAVEQINSMLRWRLSHQKFDPNKETEEFKDKQVRDNTRCTIFLGYTSNMVSCGNREIIRYLMQHRMINCVVTTGGAIEEDIMKCFFPHYMGDFKLRGKDLRLKGFNRIGNLLVPNKNYIAFEDWLKPILAKMLDEQEPTVQNVTILKKHFSRMMLRTCKAGTMIIESETSKIKAKSTILSINDIAMTGKMEEDVKSFLDKISGDNSEIKLTLWVPGEVFSPSKIIRRMGKEIDNKDSILYWAYKNDIPIFCPAITDGAVGDVVFFHSYQKEGMIIDTAQDIKKINEMAMNAPKTGMIILGGGIVKHHICNANLMRNGADFSVFVNTGQEFDGSDSGARPDEAISWGKIRLDAKPVKVYGDASLIWPLLVSQTFVKYIEQASANEETKGTTK